MLKYFTLDENRILDAKGEGISWERETMVKPSHALQGWGCDVKGWGGGDYSIHHKNLVIVAFCIW